MKYSSMISIDLQLEAALKGDLTLSGQMISQLSVGNPSCNRIAFNKGWFELYRGNLLEGHKLLDRGRIELVFGSRHIRSIKPTWSGPGETGICLLNLEGGLGDQIHGFRFAKILELLGVRVVVCCSPELAPIFAESFIVVQTEAACGVYHDFWVPSMSAVVPLNYEYADLDGEPYIDTTSDSIPGRIGICWSGNPKFEHEQHRKFPHELLFDVVKDFDTISLQKGHGSEHKPVDMVQGDVTDWQSTRHTISQCSLVITSCTSIAHLSAAMGIRTWIVIPILPYYLWALPGDTSPYYESVTLFRQTIYDSWSEPFEEIKHRLTLEDV